MKSNDNYGDAINSTINFCQKFRLDNQQKTIPDIIPINDKVKSYLWMMVPVNLSGIALALTGAFLLMHKNFNMHPYQLIGWTCLFEGFTFTSQIDLMFSCGYILK